LQCIHSRIDLHSVVWNVFQRYLYAGGMTSPIYPRRFIALAAAALIAAGSAFIAAPGANAAKADLVVYFDRTFREVIDVGTQGSSHGDITITNGNVSDAAGGKSVGSYSTSQITVSVLIPGGRENRKTDIGITVGKGVIYTTALVAANAGTPPTSTTAHAIIGGTGKYAGVTGEMILKPLSATQYKVSFFFTE